MKNFHNTSKFILKNTKNRPPDCCFVAICSAAFFFFFVPKNEAQTVADSLGALLKKHEKRDERRVDLLNDLAWERLADDAGAAQKMLREAIGLSEKLGYEKGQSQAWNELGFLEEEAGNFEKAAVHYQKALEIRQKTGDRAAVSRTLNNLGNLAELRDSPLVALDFFQKSYQIAAELGDTSRMARTQFNVARVPETMGNYDEANLAAYEYFALADRTADADAMAKAQTILGNIQFELEDFKRAEDFYQKALALREKMGAPDRIAAAQVNMANVFDAQKRFTESDDFYQKALVFYEKEADSAAIAQVLANLGDLRKHENRLPEALVFLNRALKIYESQADDFGKMLVFNGLGDVLRRQKKWREALAFTEKYQAAAAQLGDEKYQQKAFKDLSETWAGLGDFSKAYDFRKKYDELRWKRLDERRSRDFERREQVFGDQKKQAALDRQQNELRLQEEKLARGRVVQWSLLGGAAILVAFLGLLFNRNRLRKRANEQLLEQKSLVEAERERSDELLRNILPAKIANELKERGEVAPRRFDNVTVMFTDFKGFTQVSEGLRPEELVATLDAYFKAFDAIIARHGLEKIKTIGDAYMAAAGLPEPDERHAHSMVAAALDILDFMETFNREQARKLYTTFHIRIGIHSGPVVAGVVGTRKFAYDIWGDAVNLAARMESSGEPGRVNISEATYFLVKDEFECEPRGRVLAKNKGEVEMYFVIGEKA